MTSLLTMWISLKNGKNLRILSKTTLQHSIFDRKRQIYLLKDVNRCTYTFSNSVDVGRRVSELGWINVHCPLSNMSLERVIAKFMFEMDPPLY